MERIPANRTASVAAAQRTARAKNTVEIDIGPSRSRVTGLCLCGATGAVTAQHRTCHVCDDVRRPRLRRKAGRLRCAREYCLPRVLSGKFAPQSEPTARLSCLRKAGERVRKATVAATIAARHR